jgi:hypothetical protein
LRRRRFVPPTRKATPGILAATVRYLGATLLVVVDVKLINLTESKLVDRATNKSQKTRTGNFGAYGAVSA